MLTSTESISQPLVGKSNLMILTNGRTHEFEKWKLLKDEIYIVGPNGERLILRADDVEGPGELSARSKYERPLGTHDKPLPLK